MVPYVSKLTAWLIEPFSISSSVGRSVIPSTEPRPRPADCEKPDEVVEFEIEPSGFLPIMAVATQRSTPARQPASRLSRVKQEVQLTFCTPQRLHSVPVSGSVMISSMSLPD